MARRKKHTPAERGALLHRLRLMVQVAKALGVKQSRPTVFPAVAAALGKRWTSKASGYALVEEYAERHGIRARAAKRRQAAAPDAFLMSAEWRRLRMRVLVARGARCECCGASPKDGHTVLNVDHVKPRKLFPALALVESNLQVLCAPCNHGRGNWDQTDWRAPVVSNVTH